MSGPLAKKKKRVRVLLSSYACEPGKGSEPGVGWKWVEGLAGRVDLAVITRANNRETIERDIAARLEEDPLRKVQFHYHDLSTSFLRLKRARLLPTLPYYLLWQWTASHRFAHEADVSDVVHHLTFCTALCPGFWNHTKAARVIGPVAAPLVPESYLPLFGTYRWTQMLRNFITRHFSYLPWLKKSFAGAVAVVPANSDMQNMLHGMGIDCEPVMLDTGALQPVPRIERVVNYETCRFIYAGVLERRKGLELALRAFAEALEGTTAPNIRFVILGKGPDSQRLKDLATALGIADRIDFIGAVPQVEVARRFADADVFVFASLRDASAGANLEAMAAGLPVLCLAHQGVADITDESCAIRVPLGKIRETINRLATAMERLANDPALRRRLGENAQMRAIKAFSWDEKFLRMVEIYESARSKVESD